MKTTNVISIPVKPETPGKIHLEPVSTEEIREIPPIFSSAWVSLYLQLRNKWSGNT